MGYLLTLIGLTLFVGLMLVVYVLILIFGWLFSLIVLIVNFILNLFWRLK